VSEYDSYERVLMELKLPRTRENYLFVLYDGNLPEDWDEEAEEQLPPDLRVTLLGTSDARACRAILLSEAALHLGSRTYSRCR